MTESKMETLVYSELLDLLMNGKVEICSECGDYKLLHDNSNFCVWEATSRDGIYNVLYSGKDIIEALTVFGANVKNV
jgi:ribosomal protein L32